ncbi:MAG: nucleotide exchange factor GrpE [Propionibacteriaceae bacterium]
MSDFVPENDAETIEALEAQFDASSADEPVVAEEPVIVEEVIPDLAQQLAERTEDLQRLQAEYVNYKRRVDRDRDRARQLGMESVVADLLPVLDAITAAKQHEELSGGFKLVADELAKVATKHQLVAYGEAGEVFDPQLHEAMMSVPGHEGQTEPEVGTVLQPGYTLGERIVRHARVTVAEPEN